MSAHRIAMTTTVTATVTEEWVFEVSASELRRLQTEPEYWLELLDHSPLPALQITDVAVDDEHDREFQQVRVVADDYVTPSPYSGPLYPSEPATPRPQPVRRVTVEQAVAQTKAEVVSMIGEEHASSRGVVITAEAITCFSDLHDYCDANCLGWLCDEDVIFVMPDGREVTPGGDDAQNDAWLEFGNLLQDQVDQWLREGGHRQS